MTSKQPTDLTLQCLVHDLNNVFQALVDAAALLSSDPNWTPVATSILRSVERGKGIVESIGADQRAVLPFETILSNAIRFIEDVLPPGRLRFHAEVEPGLEMRGRWGWERVLMNLFLNAAQVMPQGGDVWVRARRAGERIEITVDDDGPGIAPDILPEIFKPHFSTKPPPSGLGLHIVETIVKQNDGRVTAANRSDGRGASFTITLPAGPPARRINS